MEQLKMYLLPEIDVPSLTLPEGYSFSHYKTEEDQKAWCECCTNGALIDESIGTEAFKRAILDNPIDIYEDVLFLAHGGEHIATATCYINNDGVGDLHMVGMKTEWRGKGLAKYLVYEAVRHLNGRDVPYIFLTTDEFRKSAVRTYLDAGFLPVEYDTGMKERWEIMLKDIGVRSSMMLHDDGSFYRVIYGKTE